MKGPLVSVVMPAYNAEKYVEQAVKSILEQTYSNIELLVADDGSKDRTKFLLDSFLSDKRVKAFHNSSNQGYLVASNLLLEKCSGDYISFMDADDWSDAERIEKLLNAFRMDETLGCAGSFVKRVDENGAVLSEIKFRTGYDDIKAALPGEFSFVGSALMIRRDVLMDVGLYEPAFSRIGSEDLFWAGRIILRYKTINLPEALYYYRDSSASVSVANKKTIMGQLSKELAQVALGKLMKDGTDIFLAANEKLLAETLRYLRMKYNFWNDHYFTALGLRLGLIGRSRMGFTDTNAMVAMYSRKWMKRLLGSSK